jgi:hypothetical protein
MTEQQIKEFIEYWGDNLPNPTHYPRQFEYYVLLYRHIKGLS